MNFLRRRFSSGDLQGELKDRDENINVLNFKKGPSPSAPSSPSRSTSVSGMTHPGANKPPYNKDRCKILLVVDDQHTDWWVAPWQWLIYRKYWWCNRYQEWVLRNTERNVCKTSLDNRKYQGKSACRIDLSKTVVCVQERIKQVWWVCNRVRYH